MGFLKWPTVFAKEVKGQYEDRQDENQDPTASQQQSDTVWDIIKEGWDGWPMPLIPVLGRQRQADLCKFQGNQGNRVRFCPVSKRQGRGGTQKVKKYHTYRRWFLGHMGRGGISRNPNHSWIPLQPALLHYTLPCWTAHTCTDLISY